MSRRASTCTDPECARRRHSLASVCRHRAVLERELERLQTAQEVAAFRAGGDGRLPPRRQRILGMGNQAARREEALLLRERLRGSRALLERDQAPTAQDKIVDRLMNEKLDALFLEMENDEVSSERLAELDMEHKALEEMIRKRKKADEASTCSICLEELSPSDFMMGKNCYHLHCTNCIPMMAMLACKPSPYGVVNTSNAYWQGEGEPQEGMGPHSYCIRPEHLDEAGMLKVFPQGQHVQCPQCRDPSYADAAFWNVTKEALKTIDAEDVSDTPQEASEVVAEMRRLGMLLVLDAPKPEGYDGKDLVMIVEAKIPGTPDEEGHPHGMKLRPFFMELGYQWDHDMSKCDGKAWWRVKVAGEEVDSTNKGGGALAKTRATMHKILVPSASLGPEGATLWEEGKEARGGGTWKFEYPKPESLVSRRAREVMQAVAAEVAGEPSTGTVSEELMATGREVYENGRARVVEEVQAMMERRRAVDRAGRVVGYVIYDDDSD